MTYPKKTMQHALNEWRQRRMEASRWCDHLDTWLIRHCPPFRRWRLRMDAQAVRRVADALTWPGH